MKRDTSDQILVQNAIRGDRSAFCVIFDRHSPRVYHLLRRLTGGIAEAEDLTQETFLAAYQALGSWKARGLFSTWLCGIAVRRYRDSRRGERNGEDLPEELPDPNTDTDPHASCALREFEDALEAALDDLPLVCREVFVLIRIEQWSYKQAATELGVPVGTVQSRLWRATQMLQSRLAAHFPAASAAVSVGPTRRRGGANHVV